MTTLRVGVVVAVLLGGCVGDTEPSRQGRPDGRPSATAVSTLPELVLAADLREPPARWEAVATLPFGQRRDQLAFVRDRRRTTLPYVPLAVAVADDGSFWVLDHPKRRVAHFSSDGVFVGDLGGLFADRAHPAPVDLAVHEGGVFVLQLFRTRASLVELTPAGPTPQRILREGDRGLSASYLLRQGGDLIAYVPGAAMDIRSGEPPVPIRRFGAVDVGTGAVRLLPGAPVASRAWVALEADTDQTFTVEYATTSGTVRRPLRVVAFDDRGRRVAATVGARIEVAMPQAVGVVVELSTRDGGGRWFLRMPADGSTLLWERLPEPDVVDTGQVRHLALGPDGRVYLAVATTAGLRILRR